MAIWPVSALFYRQNMSNNPFPLLATYALIYSFLLSQSQDKAAEVVKKAAKDIIKLKDGGKTDAVSLEEIIRWWKQSRECV